MIVWLASYPRSGNTWIRTLLKNIYNIETYSIHGDEHDIGSNEETSKIVGHKNLPEDFSIKAARESEDTYFIKTHLLYQPEYKEDKVIYLIRDGREATISYHYYHLNFTNLIFTKMQIINGYPFVGSWCDHVQSWMGQLDLNRIIIKFEDATTNFNKTVNLLSDFLSKQPISYDVPDFNKLHSIDSNFFRSGKTNSYKNELSLKEQAYFWYVNGFTMNEFGYEAEEDVINDKLLLNEVSAMHVNLTTEKNVDRLQKNMGNKFSIIRKTQIEEIALLKEKNNNLTERIRNLKEININLRERINQVDRNIFIRAIRKLKSTFK